MMTRFLWEMSLNDSKLLSGEEVRPLVGWEYSPVQISGGPSRLDVLDMREFVTNCRDAGATRLDLLSRIDRVEDPWWRSSIEELVLLVRPMDATFSMRNWYDDSWQLSDVSGSGAWRHELFPSEYPGARQWSITECQQRLDNALSGLADHPDEHYRTLVRDLRSVLRETEDVQRGTGTDPLLVPARTTAPQESAGLFAAAHRLNTVDVFHSGGLADFGGVDHGLFGELVLSHLQSLAALTRL